MHWSHLLLQYLHVYQCMNRIHRRLGMGHLGHVEAIREFLVQPGN